MNEYEELGYMLLIDSLSEQTPRNYIPQQVVLQKKVQMNALLSMLIEWRATSSTPLHLLI